MPLHDVVWLPHHLCDEIRVKPCADHGGNLYQVAELQAQSI